MQWLIRYINKSLSLLFWKQSRYKAKKVEELPDELDRKSVYLVGENNHLWFAAMLCPCGCGSVLQMGLMAAQRPRWTVVEHNDGTVSLHPSVWRIVGCKSHFWLRRGKINWCHD